MNTEISLSSHDLKVALIPLEVVWGEKRVNIDRLTDAFSSLHRDTDLVVVPETFSTGFPVGMNKAEVEALAEPKGGVTISFLKELAISRNAAICGTFIEKCNHEGLRNSSFFIEPNGEAVYSAKKHLFSMGSEAEIFRPGDNRLHVRFRGWNIALIVCYEIRFPIWCRNVGNEYDLLVAVAEWPEVRISSWNKLLPARAIENQAYVCGVNCKGTDPMGFNYDGSSPALDFIGNEIGWKDPKTGIIYATLRKDKLEKFRMKFPAWKDADSFKIID